MRFSEQGHVRIGKKDKQALPTNGKKELDLVGSLFGILCKRLKISKRNVNAEAKWSVETWLIRRLAKPFVSEERRA